MPLLLTGHTAARPHPCPSTHHVGALNVLFACDIRSGPHVTFVVCLLMSTGAPGRPQPAEGGCCSPPRAGGRHQGAAAGGSKAADGSLDCHNCHQPVCLPGPGQCCPGPMVPGEVGNLEVAVLFTVERGHYLHGIGPALPACICWLYGCPGLPPHCSTCHMAAH